MPTDNPPGPIDGTLVTYSVSEAALILRGQAGTAEVKWLRRKLNQGEFPGYKAARKWRMTGDDVSTAITKMRPANLPDDLPVMAGLTRTSRRRLAI